jgi:molecular chaperone DnaJ
MVAGVRGRPLGDPYAVLGLAPGATVADVQRAYRRRARLLHPDIAGEQGTARMAELNLARDTVLAQLQPPDGPR